MGERTDAFHGDPRRRHWRVTAWLLALALPLATGIAYLTTQGDPWWWLINVAGIPLVFLVVSRQEWLQRTRGESEPLDAGISDGPWTPP